MSKDLGDTKNTLEKEHKLVVLQMQAINELWKKVFVFRRVYISWHTNTTGYVLFKPLKSRKTRVLIFSNYCMIIKVKLLQTKIRFNYFSDFF